MHLPMYVTNSDFLVFEYSLDIIKFVQYTPRVIFFLRIMVKRILVRIFKYLFEP